MSWCCYWYLGSGNICLLMIECTGIPYFLTQILNTSFLNIKRCYVFSVFFLFCRIIQTKYCRYLLNDRTILYNQTALLGNWIDEYHSKSEQSWISIISLAILWFLTVLILRSSRARPIVWREFDPSSMFIDIHSYVSNDWYQTASTLKYAYTQSYMIPCGVGGLPLARLLYVVI